MMKRFGLSLLLCLSSVTLLSAEDDLLTSYVSFSIFFQPESDSALVEIYWKIPANEIKYVGGQGKVLSEILLRTRTGEIVYIDKYAINSPFAKDTLALNYSLIDVRRIELPAQDYLLQITLADGNDTLRTAYHEQIIPVIIPVKNAFFSDILLLDTVKLAKTQSGFTRNNLDLMPSVVPYINEDHKRLLFYIELNRKQPDKVRLKYSIKNVAGEIIGDYAIEKYKNAGLVTPIYDGWNIKELPAGIYYLHVELLDDSSKSVANKALLFYRHTAHLGFDSFAFTVKVPAKEVRQFIPYLNPLLNADQKNELKALEHSSDTIAIKNWFLAYWQRIDSTRPYEAYTRYAKQIAYANTHYGTQLREGYLSDQGRIFLKYGLPSDVISSMEEPNAYPYEIWHYYRLESQTDVRFVFYNPTQISGEMELLHSNAFGEMQNPKWKKAIYRRTARTQHPDDNSVPDANGNNLDWRMAE
ncbi:MAG: GWxTD domain-containing protein [Bacteroidota bacterium]|nr:GWxTD domain-containing protein [Bacteroidota bacterium]